MDTPLIHNGNDAESTTGCSNQKRFELELEFVQCLSSPQYLNWLAQNRFLEDPAFLNYLKYLQYWTKPEYSHFVIYPHALFFLDMLQSKEFRSSIGRTDIREMVHSQQFYFWQNYRSNRLRDPDQIKPEGESEGKGLLATTLA